MDNLTQSKSMESQTALTSLSEAKKKYRIISTDGEKYGYIEAVPSEPIVKNLEALGAFMILLSVANDVNEIPKRKKLMIYEAMRQNQLTVDESLNCIWKAYGDPYLPAGQIEFRHLMKYINETRETTKVKYYTYEQVLSLMDKEGVPQSAFTITDKIQGGKKLWKRAI